MQQVFFYLVVALLVFLPIYLIRPGWNLRIRVRDGLVEVDGRAVAGKRGQIIDFFVKELPEVRQAKVQGYWNRRRLRLRFRGISPGQRQRIRNFLLMIL